MKKNLFLALVLITSLTSLAHARFFIGIDGGYSMDRVDGKAEDMTIPRKAVGTPSGPGVFSKDIAKGNGYLFDINLGTEHHFDENNYIGFRWFLGLGYGRTNLVNQAKKSISYPSNILEANLGLDLLLDVIKFGDNSSLGIFGGIEGDSTSVKSDHFYEDFTTSSKATYTAIKKEKGRLYQSANLSVAARAGLSLLIAEHHRIEFIAKIPVYVVGESFDGLFLFYKPIQFMLGYKFVF